jgi:hypothetical protein
MNEISEKILRQENYSHVLEKDDDNNPTDRAKFGIFEFSLEQITKLKEKPYLLCQLGIFTELVEIRKLLQDIFYIIRRSEYK